MTTGEVQKLAALARIRVEDAELEQVAREFDAIVKYVGQLESLNLSPASSIQSPALKNVMREDGEPHETGKYTGKLVEQFPSFAKATEGKPASEAGVYLEVKQIITHE